MNESTTTPEIIKCPCCGVEMTPDPQKLFSGAIVYLYTCRRDACTLGAMEVTLDAQQWSEFDEPTLAAYIRSQTRKVVQS